jgi:hypothetical protein
MRHITDTRSRLPGVPDGCRADIDRLLDRRAWLTLPVTSADATGRSRCRRDQ